MGRKYETAPQRALVDFKDWVRNYILAQVLFYLVPGGGAVLATIFIPPEISFKVAVICGFLGGLIGLGLLYLGVYLFQFSRAPYKQRDEAHSRLDEIEAQRDNAQVKTATQIYDEDMGRHWSMIKNKMEQWKNQLLTLADENRWVPNDFNIAPKGDPYFCYVLQHYPSIGKALPNFRVSVALRKLELNKKNSDVNAIRNRCNEMLKSFANSIEIVLNSEYSQTNCKICPRNIDTKQP